MTAFFVGAALWFFSPALPAVQAAETGTNPLFIRNAFPPFQGLTPPPLSGVQSGNEFGLHLTYASTHLDRSSPRWNFAVDQETAILDLVFRRSFAEVFELALQLPLISQHSGFLDGALQDYHELFGFPDYGRSQRPLNRFLYQIDRDGGAIIGGDSGAGPGDLGIRLKGRVLKTKGGLSLAGLVFIDLPTGDADRGRGNGNLDGGAAVLLETPLPARLHLVVNGGFFLPGDLRGSERISTEAYGYGGADLAWQALPRAAFHLQVVAQGSPYPETGIREIDDTAVILAVGGRFRPAKRLELEFSFSEDPSTAGAPDFMFSTGLRLRY